jgi:hypothetical protein
MINSIEIMPTKLLIVMMAGFALAAGACTGDDDPLPSTPSPNPVVDTFTGTLTRNGAQVEAFSVTASGDVRAAISKLEPDSTVIVGLSIGTWNGAACQTVISNDNATQGTAVVGTADRQGRLCVRIYDAEGTLPAPTNYEINVTHF